MPRTDVGSSALSRGIGASSPSCKGFSMCSLKYVGFGWTDLGPHPVPCTWSCRREDRASVSLGCPSSHGYKGVSAAVPSNAGLESGGWFPPHLGMQNQPHPMALRGWGSCNKRDSKNHQAAGWADLSDFEWTWNLDSQVSKTRKLSSAKYSLFLGEVVDFEDLASSLGSVNDWRGQISFSLVYQFSITA